MSSGDIAKGASERDSIQVLSRSFAILRALEGSTEGLSLSQIAERTGLPRSSVHRLVRALDQEGFVAPASTNGGILLGPEVMRLAESVRSDLRRVLRGTMEGLFSRLDETVDLAVLDVDHLRFIDQIPAPHRLRAVSAVGETFPLHCTANGKAVLALLPPESLSTVLPPPLARYTPNTITDRDALLTELDQIRHTNIAFDHDEHTDGISAAGFAIGHGRGTYAAISVPMPTARFATRVDAVTAAVQDAYADAVAALGD